MYFVVLDLDDTLVCWRKGEPRLCESTIDVLDALVKKGARLGVISQNQDAKRCCESLGIAGYFEFIMVSKRGKVDMLKQVLREQGVSRDSVIFLDDNGYNVGMVREFGVISVHVNGQTGVTVQDVSVVLK